VIIEVDVTTIPPAVVLLEADDFTAFKIVARGRHAFVGRKSLLALSGAEADDPASREQVDKMLALAVANGWVNELRATRAHIEYCP
jgi:hypothetical protein